MQEQNYIKEVLEAHIAKNGCTAKHVCRQTDIEQSDLSRFRSGLKYLSEKDFESLKRYLNQQ